LSSYPKTSSNASLPIQLSQLRGFRREGAGWRAFCPAHQNRNKRSLSIRVTDGLILLYCFCGCTIQAICDALRLRVVDLFIASGTVNSTPQWSLEQRRAYARDIWRHSHRAPGTIAEHYLSSRGIVLAPPPSIRFIALRKHREFGWPFPVMVAGLQDRDDQFSGVLVTYLAADGSGKAPVDPVRKTYGVLRGSTVRLAPAGERLVMCEGIETGLSVAQACPELPVWCALSAMNLARVDVPTCVREIIIAADGDEAGERAAKAAATKFLREGRGVRIARPEPGRDFNDELTA